MAIDKNSKAYNSLLNKGYTDEQITQMYDTASKQGTTKGVVPTTYDPMADLTPEYIANMDMNKQIRGANQSFSQYGDDSSRDKQDTRGGLNQKYTGEGVKTSDINYNPDITTKDLNPNFVYGKQSQVYGTDHPGYISQRNDDIASALYNEGLVSREDVTRFLMAQNGFTNSSEEDRLNTIESVWKRLGAIAEQNREKPDPSKAEELLTDTSGKIYGKVTADEGNPKEGIDTLADDNSVFRMMQESRAANLKAFIAMNPADIAELMVSGKSPFSDQTLRDAKQYYPEFMAEVEVEKKKKLGQQNVNAMTSGNYSYVTSEMDAKKGNIESSIDAMSKEYASNAEQAESTKQDIENSVATNQTASEASKTMEAIEKEAATLKNRLKNLREEANAAFKGDVPDYLVNAYINNKSQEIQNQLSILEDRYNAAYQRYTTQLDQEWKQKQYNLQERQIKLQEDKFEYEKQQTKTNNNVIEKDGVFYEVKYTDDGVVINELQVQKQYTDSGMKGAGLRNNNPGNIKDNDFGNVIGHDSRGFAIFATPEDGFDALVEKIKYNQTNPNSKYYGDTILEYFEKYAPSSDGNTPLAYANEVARQLGVSINTPISQLDPVKFAAAIAKHDSGYDYSTYGQFRGGSSDNQTSFDINSIEVPDDVYTQEVGENKDGSKITRKVDPNSEEGKKLAKEYREKKAAEMGYTTDGSTGVLIADEDGKNTAAYRIMSSDGETPLIFRQRLYNLVPTQLKNSEKELDNLYDIAKQLYKAGYTADEASMVFYGVDPRQDKTGMLKTLVYKSRMGKDLPDSYYGDLGGLVDAGELDQAVAKVETSVLPKEYIAEETKAISIIKKIERLRDKLKEADSVVGPFDGTVADFKNKYVEGGGIYQQVASDIVQIYSDIRKELLGSAITETELEANKDMFPSMTDKMNTIKVKIQSLENSLIDNLNGYRDIYKLPELTKKSLLNQSLRKYQYGYSTSGNSGTSSSGGTDLS